MQARTLLRRLCLVVIAAPLLWMNALRAQEPPPPPKSSFMPVVPKEPFAAVMNRMAAAKAAVMAKHNALLAARYDLANRPAGDATMFRGKAVQAGVRAKLPGGVTWAQLGTMTPAQIRERGAVPPGFPTLPPPNQPQGGTGS